MFKNKFSVSYLPKLVIFLFSFLIIGFLLSFHHTQDSLDITLKEGLPAPKTMYAPFDFSYMDEKATEEARRAAVSIVPPVYEFEENILTDAIQKVSNFMAQVKEIKSKEEGGYGPYTYESFISSLSMAEIKALKDEEDLALWELEIRNIINEAFRQGIITTQDKFMLLSQRWNRVLLVRNNEGTNLPLSDLRTLDDVKENVYLELREKLGKQRALRDALVKLVNMVLKPNLFFNEKLTQNNKVDARKNAPEIREDIKKGEMVILKGQRVTAKGLDAFEVIRKRTVKQEFIKKIFSQAIIVFLLFVFLFGYIYYFERKSFRNRDLLLIHGLLVFTLIICKVILFFGWSYYLLPLALPALLLTLLLKPRMGYPVGIIMSVLGALLCDWSIEVLLLGIIGTFIGVFSAIGLRKRIEFIKVGLIVGVGQMLIIFSSQLFEGALVANGFQVSLSGMVNGLLITTPLFTLMLPLMEHAFNLTTDITLLELSDLNHPLLKRMVIEAPGTYHHSLIVSHISEEACKIIGANSLLARVGCYFHDVGKMAKSEYFVENQQDKSKSKHVHLTPQMSSVIILDHVKGGITLAKKYKLKDCIINFIPEHQGMGVVYFFYKRALENKKPGEVVNQDDFRYPGPKPQSKETAVAMMADSIEAASRAMKEYNEENIKELVNRIITEKLQDGQFDESHLTINDLNLIKQSFVRTLLAVYHTRIPYSKENEQPKDN